MKIWLIVSFAINVFLVSAFSHPNQMVQDMPTPTPEMGLPPTKEQYIEGSDRKMQDRIFATDVSEYLQVPFAEQEKVFTKNEYFGEITLTVVGAGQSAGTALNDAFYLYLDDRGNSIFPPRFVNPFELYINGDPAVNMIGNRPLYQQEHAYVFTVNVGTSPQRLNFSLGDTFTRDNSGGFSIGVSETAGISIVDSDGDAIFDHWETEGGGIDGNGDGIIDVDLFALGARPDRKDIFLEIDWTDGAGNETHKPSQESIDLVIESFSRHGIALHVDLSTEAELSNSIPETLELRVIDFCGEVESRNPACPSGVTSFNSVKERFFGSGNDPQAVKDARALVYHYALFVRNIGEVDGPFGKAEQNGNDLIVAVSCGYSDGKCTHPVIGDFSRTSLQAGTMMHELGHNLGLDHGGPVTVNDSTIIPNDIRFKPNYFSIMNHFFTATGIPTANNTHTIYDYSDRKLPTLVEDSLQEDIGVGEERYLTYYTCAFPRVGLLGFGATNIRGPVVANNGINWNCLPYPFDRIVSSNINNPIYYDTSPVYVIYDDGLRELEGYNDWEALAFDFRKFWAGLSDFHLGAFDIVEPNLQTLFLISNPKIEVANTELSVFTSQIDNNGIMLIWETVTEANIIGFNIYRAIEETGQYSKINEDLIPAAGNSNSPKSYEYLDEFDNRSLLYYMLESVGINGVTVDYGPIEVNGSVDEADLSLTKNSAPNPVVKGLTVKYTLNVTNDGPSDAIETILVDKLSPHINLVSVNSAEGNCSELSGTVTCNLGNLANSESATIEIVVATNNSTPSTIINNASVSSTTRDPNPDNNSASVTTTVTSASLADRPMLVSSSANGSIAGLKFSDEDILYFDPSAAVANRWKMYFDGSDVGVSNTDVDALEFVNEGPYGALLLSFDKAIQLPMLGKVADADIVKFTFVAPPGPNTSGSFSSCFVGSAFDLTSGAEDIDALAFDAQGRMLISVSGTAKVNGTTLNAKDEDLLLFSQTPFTCNPSSGSWSIWVDGSNLALTSGSEDLNSAWVDTASASGALYMSTKGNYVAQSTVNTTSGDSDDLFGFAPSSTGENNTAGFLSAFFDGDLVGFTKAIDGLYILPAGSSIAISAAGDATENTAAVEQFAVDDQLSDAQDEEIDEFDEETEDTRTELFLPFITR